MIDFAEKVKGLEMRRRMMPTTADLLRTRRTMLSNSTSGRRR